MYLNLTINHQSELLGHFRYTKNYLGCRKENFFLKKIADIVVIRESKQFYPPGGAKRFSLISLEIKNKKSSKNFGAKRGAKKKVIVKYSTSLTVIF